MKRLLISPTRNEQRFFVLIFALIGFVAPMIYGFVNDYPVPAIHDEFSYLLAGDTFAHGRLTNPTPEFSEHFEAPHTLVKPTYMSKYPPMQGLFLALGQVLFGHPIFGVWISCGLAAAALFWMLSIWSRPLWAIVGTILMILIIGIDSYWAQSYWGGMVAFAGGALFFGGFRRITKKQFLLGSTIIMTLGGVLLINSRPFEGTITMLPALMILLYRIIFKSGISFARKLSQILLPGIFIACLALSAMAYYNYRVTGNALRFPYTEHQSQYFSAPLFIFQSPANSELQGTPRLKKLYKLLDKSGFILNIDMFGLPDVKYLYPVYNLISQFLNLPILLLMPPLAIFLYLTAFALMRKSRWTRFLILTVLFTYCCMSFGTYSDLAHYSAPLACCIYLLIVQGFRLFSISAKKSSKRVLTAALIIVLISLSFFYKKFLLDGWFIMIPTPTAAKDLSGLKVDLTKSNKLEIPEFSPYLKQFIEEKVKDDNEKYLALVDCHISFKIYEDITFNGADLDNSKLIWAIDLGEEKNKALVNHYQDRKILKVEIKGTDFLIEPYNSQK